MGCSSSSVPRGIFEHTYRRTALAKKPAYDYIIGNLEECKKFIEGNTFNAETRVKEELCMFCVINPPRQGKSLLLDNLYLNRTDDVLVIEITYTSNTSFIESELESPACALQYFWLRVLKSVLYNTRDTLMEIQELVDSKELNLAKIRNYSQKFYGKQRDPFLMLDGSEKHVLVCVDEFSLITDRIRELWTPADQKSFVSSLHNSNSWKVRFVLTGFNIDMNTLLQTSGKINKVDLSMCSFRSSKPLLRRIKEAYYRKGMEMPAGLFECIKCSPGLVGLWAERVHEGRFDINLSHFCEHAAQWFVVMRENRIAYWQVVEDFLILLENQNSSVFSEEMFSCGHTLVFNQLGLGSIDDCIQSSPPQVIPICMVYLSRLILSERDWPPLRKLLLTHLRHAVDACESPSSDQKDGKQFEDFVYHALHARLLLRHHYFRSPGSAAAAAAAAAAAVVVGPSLIHVPCTSTALFPSNTFKLHQRVDGKIAIVHQLTSREDLRLFLLTSLSYLFPVGVAELDQEDDDSEPRPSKLGIFLNQQHAEYEICQSNEPISHFNLTLLGNTSGRSPQIQLVIKKPLSIDPSDCDTLKKILTGQKGLQKDFLAVDRERGVLMTGLQTILSCIDGKCPSILKTARCAEGADLLVVWVETQNAYVDADEIMIEVSSTVDDEVAAKKRIVHLAAIELVDERKNTTIMECQSKVALLLSERCLVWWLKDLFADEMEIVFHVVLAGREHC